MSRSLEGWREEERTTGRAKCARQGEGGKRGRGRRKREEKEKEGVIVEGSMKGARQAEEKRRVTRERKGERETCERALGEMVGLGSNRHGYGA